MVKVALLQTHVRRRQLPRFIDALTGWWQNDPRTRVTVRVGFVLSIILGLAGAVAAALIGAWAVLWARRPLRSHVELVDVTISEVEVVDVTIGEPGLAPSRRREVRRRVPPGRDQSPVVDVKVRNIGGQPAVLKRVVVHVERAVRCQTRVMGLMPYRAVFYGASLPVSATYDVAIPPPEQAAGLHAPLDISQVIAPGNADRFEVRLGMEPTFDRFAYLVNMELIYDGDNRSVTSAPVAVAFPRGVFVSSIDQIRSEIRWFLEGVSEVRHAIDQEMAARRLPIPDWTSDSLKSRGDLPDGLLSVDGVAANFGSFPEKGIYEVTDAFWDPQLSVMHYLREFAHTYSELVEIVTAAAVVDDSLCSALPEARATLARLPELYDEFLVPHEPPPAEKPSRPDSSSAVKQPAALMRDLLDGKEGVDELFERVLSGDEGTLWFLSQVLVEGRLDNWMARIGIGSLPGTSAATEFLDEYLRIHKPSDPEAFRIREKLAERLDEYLRYKPSDPEAFRIRQKLAERLAAG